MKHFLLSSSVIQKYKQLQLDIICIKFIIDLMSFEQYYKQQNQLNESTSIIQLFLSMINKQFGWHN
jgi:hypothetical protein